ncbi:MAG: hypothetical protein WC841_04090 [Candidatus Shapirobacteria bacterium]|jgi:hypothetical protein
MNRLLAAVDIKDTPLGGGNTLGGSYPTFSVIVNIILKNSITIAGTVLLGLLIFGGVTYIIGAGNGDPKKAAQGQQAITSSFIGFGVVVFAYSIIQIIQVITGLEILNPLF